MMPGKATRLSQTLGLSVLFLFLSQTALAESAEKDANAKKYRQLISQLVSPNKEPTVRFEYGDASVRLPPGYDVKAQLQIKAVRQTLHDNVEEALPYLIESLGDNRYCMTTNFGEGDSYDNRSVGEICRDIVAHHLEVYRDTMTFSEPAQWVFYNYSISKEWYSKRKNRSLARLQREAIDWAIDRHKEADKIWPDDRRGDEISKLRKLRDSIAKAGVAAKRERSRMTPMVTSNQGPDSR